MEQYARFKYMRGCKKLCAETHVEAANGCVMREAMILDRKINKSPWARFVTPVDVSSVRSGDNLTKQGKNEACSIAEKQLV